MVAAAVAIAVAVRLDAPILVRESLFELSEEGPLHDDSGQSVSLGEPSRPQPGGSAPATPALKL